MADNFENHQRGLDSPADLHKAITPGTADLDPKPRSLYCQTAGNVVIADRAGTQLPYAVTAGQILPFRGVKVLATGTSGAANGVTTTATVYGWE